MNTARVDGISSGYLARSKSTLILYTPIRAAKAVTVIDNLSAVPGVSPMPRNATVQRRYTAETRAIASKHRKSGVMVTISRPARMADHCFNVNR